MKSVMKHQFSRIPQASIPRSTFNRTHAHKTTFDAGWLIPFYVDEALPGDTFNLNATLFVRLNTPLLPIMDNMFLDVHYFFVPLRLLWTNFKRFMGERDPDPDSSVDYVTPKLTSTVGTGWLAGTLSDYFGLPTEYPDITVAAFHHRAYNLIWNAWFRDENLQDSVTVGSTGTQDIDDGPDAEADYALLRRGKRHDYFTSCLPWPQKGDAVTLPLGTEARIATDGANDQDVSVWSTITPGYVTMDTQGGVGDQVLLDRSTTGNEIDRLYADLTLATSATINALREAFQLQRLFERDARGGTRYTELIKSHFGVTSPDARLQRPEYLGGSTAEVNIRAVAQTSVAAGTPQGHLAGVGTIMANAGFSKSFTEHGVLMGFCSVRAGLTYQEGVPRMFSRSTKVDFFWPSLAHLGEQSVLNQEIYADGTANDILTFGYQERYAEYRYFPSKITGVFRGNHAATLEAWHLSEFFNALPTLGAAFIVSDPPLDRCIATPAEPHFNLDSYIQINCARPMPVYGVPGLIDHF